MQGPQQPPVGRQYEGEGHGEAQAQVAQDVGDGAGVPAVPVRGAGRPHALQLVAAPAEEGRQVPAQGPEPGEAHADRRVLRLEGEMAQGPADHKHPLHGYQGHRAQGRDACARKHTHTHTPGHTCTHARTYMHARRHAHIHTCHVHMHKQPHSHTHTHTHTNRINTS